MRALKPRNRRAFDRKWQPEPNTGCWLWTAALNHAGYGSFMNVGAHRVSWMLHRGPIPDGMVIDHVCRVRTCVNPEHLRVVTRTVNSLENSRGTGALNAQKTHCKRGHPLSGDNLYSSPHRRQRICLTCWRAWHANNKARIRARYGFAPKAAS